MVSAVSQFSSGAAAVQPAPPVRPRPRPEDLFNALDTGSKGYFTQADLQSAIVKISDQGKRLSAADAQAQAKEIFTKIDANGDGKATLQEFKQAPPPDGPPGGPPGGPQGAKGGKPPGGGRGEGGGGAGGTSKSDASYDPADTNKDGAVSDLERLAYSAKHWTAATKTAIKTYQTVSENSSQAAA